METVVLGSRNHLKDGHSPASVRHRPHSRSVASPNYNNISKRGRPSSAVYHSTTSLHESPPAAQTRTTNGVEDVNHHPRPNSVIGLSPSNRRWSSTADFPVGSPAGSGSTSFMSPDRSAVASFSYILNKAISVIKFSGQLSSYGETFLRRSPLSHFSEPPFSGVLSPRPTPLCARAHLSAVADRCSLGTRIRAYSRAVTFSSSRKHERKPGDFSSHCRRMRDVTWNGEEGWVKFHLRGRPVVLYAPSTFNKEDYDPSKSTLPPTHRLKLEWVYGYRGKDCRSNVHLLPTGEIVYFVAAVAVLFNPEEQSQRHYLGHTDDIKSLAVHPNRLIVATGQTAGHDRKEARPHVRVWDSVSLHTLHILGVGEFERSVACLAFSKVDGGSLLCCIDEAPDHNISLWDWQRGERGSKLVETKCSADTVLGVEFHPLDKNSILTFGKGHLYFWTYEGGTLKKKLALFERDKPKYVTCLAFSDTGEIISGDTNGNIIIWKRGSNSIGQIVKGAHEGGVFSICAMKDGSVLPEPYGAVRTVAQGKGPMLLVGTTRNCILHGTWDLGLNPLIMGHTEEIWALAVHPSQFQFLTGGYDKVLRMWDSMARAPVWSKDMEDAVQSACFSPDGSVLVVGLVTGRWIAMIAETREHLSAHTDGSEPIQVVRFSPSGNILALGSRDNNIYIYEVSEDFTKFDRVGRCSGHSSFITHLDWSADGAHLQSTSGDYEILFWNATTCRQITQPSTLRDEEWSTQTCTLGFSVLGIWQEGLDGTDINACDRSHGKNLLAVGDDFGKVRLYSYPSHFLKSMSHVFGGHSSHVTDVHFLAEDSRLISIGGRDASVMQWTIEQE
ncbi:unnamed protein product [Darwinula stevensoni]|uniref:Echinoderm microtubule-associated protein-like 2 n=1 Tax=Darwinula stevensoni TaxID=69355 RepID=A0A7R9A2X6_9CRUS|nr:unnamed protein product [Darwinula stevensoni]CAG0886575.1 unnamed protein product [Darwinula stevensoni]